MKLHLALLTWSNFWEHHSRSTGLLHTAPLTRRPGGVDMKAQLAVLTVSVAAMIAAANLQSQVTGATIIGKVMDSTGTPVNNAQVHVIRPSSGTQVEVNTNESGSYTVPNLNPGTYNISVTAPTFSTVVANGVTLEVGQNVAENFTLTPGTVVQQVEVSEAVPVVDLASS